MDSNKETEWMLSKWNIHNYINRCKRCADFRSRLVEEYKGRIIIENKYLMIENLLKTYENYLEIEKEKNNFLMSEMKNQETPRLFLDILDLEKYLNKKCVEVSTQTLEEDNISDDDIFPSPRSFSTSTSEEFEKVVGAIIDKKLLKKNSRKINKL